MNFLIGENMKKVLMTAFFLLISIFAYAGKNQQDEIISVLPATLNEKEIRNWTMDNDGNFYYVVKRDEKYFILDQEKEVGPFDSFPYLNYVSKYGLIYEIVEDEKCYYSIGNKKLGPYDSIDWGICFSENDEHYFFLSKTGDVYFIITDSKTFGPFKREPSFTEINNDGSICYGVSNDFKTEIFIDSNKIDETVYTSFSYGRTDSFYYAKNEACRGTYSFYYGGEILGPYENIILLYSEDKPIWLYQEKGSKKTIAMCGDKKCGELPFDLFNHGYNIRTKKIGKDIDCTFTSSNDENKYIYRFHKGRLISYSYSYKKDGKEFISFNEKEYGPYDDFIFSCLTEDSVSWISNKPSAEIIPEGPAGIDGNAHPPFLISPPNYGEQQDFIVYKDGKEIYKFNNRNDIYFDDLITNKNGDYVLVYDFHNLCVNGKVHNFGHDGFFFLQGFVNETSDFIAMTTFAPYLGYSLWKNDRFHKTILTDDSVYYIDENVIRKIKLK